MNPLPLGEPCRKDFKSWFCGSARAPCPPSSLRPFFRPFLAYLTSCARRFLRVLESMIYHSIDSIINFPDTIIILHDLPASAPSMLSTHLYPPLFLCPFHRPTPSSLATGEGSPGVALLLPSHLLRRFSSNFNLSEEAPSYAALERNIELELEILDGAYELL